MQCALHSFDEISPFYLGGNSGTSLSIKISCKSENLSHYDSLDYGASIALWATDETASKNCDQYLVFNNIIQTIDDKETKSCDD